MTHEIKKGDWIGSMKPNSKHMEWANKITAAFFQDEKSYYEEIAQHLAAFEAEVIKRCADEMAAIAEIERNEGNTTSMHVFRIAESKLREITLTAQPEKEGE